MSWGMEAVQGQAESTSCHCATVHAVLKGGLCSQWGVFCKGELPLHSCAERQTSVEEQRGKSTGRTQPQLRPEWSCAAEGGKALKLGGI